MIRTSGLHKIYRSRGREVIALDGVDLHVREGEIFGVLGRSGAGKSTLIRCINLLERPTGGTVTVGGKELTALTPAELRRERRQIGMIFQHFNLLSSRTVADNIALPLEIMGVDRATRAAKVAELLDLVGLADKAKAYPAQLSGGQKQRVGIARALAGDPKVLLSDEATSALDPETTRSILDLLRDLNRRLGLTILLITHQMDVVKSICDAVALMSGGRVIDSGPVSDLLSRPGSSLARDMFPLGKSPVSGAATVVEITLAGGEAEPSIITELARKHDLAVTLLGAAVETLGGRQVGRLRIELPGPFQQNASPIGFLRERGLLVEVLGAPPAAEPPGHPSAPASPVQPQPQGDLS